MSSAFETDGMVGLAIDLGSWIPKIIWRGAEQTRFSRVGQLRLEIHGGHMVIMRLDHVQVAAPRGGERTAPRFYGELLQMSEVAKSAALTARGGVWFQAGAQQLHVGIDEPFVPARKAHPAFAVDQLDSLAERLQAAGVQVTWDDAIAGQRRFSAADPFGNRLEFVPG